MILYVNGDSHAAGAEAVNPFAFAEDDKQYFYMGRVPHPDNARVSWPRKLADVLKARLHCEAESASSNTRIIRTTREWIKRNQILLHESLIIIQWSTWERQEWLHDNTYYQVNASGTDHLPNELHDRYRQYIAEINWQECTSEAHREIWNFHNELIEMNIPHIFFNGNNHFGKIPESDQRDWGTSYIGPYAPEMTFDMWLKNNNYQTVAPNSWHFGADAHTAWYRFMLQYVMKHNFIG